MTAPGQPLPDAYACRRCGRRDGLDAVATNDLWARISAAAGDANILCLWCMDAVAADLGVGRATVSLHFFGRALCGTSRSAADEQHLRRLDRDRHLAEQRADAAEQALCDVDAIVAGTLVCPACTHSACAAVAAIADVLCGG